MSVSFDVQRNIREKRGSDFLIVIQLALTFDVQLNRPGRSLRLERVPGQDLINLRGLTGSCTFRRKCYFHYLLLDL